MIAFLSDDLAVLDDGSAALLMSVGRSYTAVVIVPVLIVGSIGGEVSIGGSRVLVVIIVNDVSILNVLAVALVHGVLVVGLALAELTFFYNGEAELRVEASCV